MEEVFLSNSLEETQQYAEEFAQKLSTGGVVLFYGNLGAGKTTFVQGFAKGLGITKRIISPTFIILRTYEIPQLSSRAQLKDLSQDSLNDPLQEIFQHTSVVQHDKSKNFYHVDLYRMQSEKEIEDLGLVHLMQNPDNIIAIEWPERLGSFMPKDAWKISIETAGENERKITIKK